MFRNHYITIAAWIIVYISLWLSRDNLVSSKFSKNNCHTGFVSRIIETMIFPFQWYKNRPTYEYVVGLVLLCCISVVAVIKCFSVFSSIEQPMIEAIFEHCNFTFISTVSALPNRMRIPGAEVWRRVCGSPISGEQAVPKGRERHRIENLLL